DGATVHNLAENQGFLARYLAVPKTRGEAILFHDDDVLLGLEQLERLRAAWLAEPRRLYGPRGRMLSRDDRLILPGIVHGQCDLICGSCSLFSRDLFTLAWPLLSSYLSDAASTGDIFGEDDVAFSLATTRATGRRPCAVDDGPLEDLGTRDGNATHRRVDY